MEKVNGGTLEQFIIFNKKQNKIKKIPVPLGKKLKPLNEEVAASIAKDICNGLFAIHKKNFIHRDLKPENILINNQCQIKICDFGWCVELNVGARSTFCGTYEYMAPEIIREKPYDHSIDVWSLGILLYELLHGYSPFKAKENYNDCYEVFDKIINWELEYFEQSLCLELIKNYKNGERYNKNDYICIRLRT